jgi:hypothetical protein
MIPINPSKERIYSPLGPQDTGCRMQDARCKMQETNAQRLPTDALETWAGCSNIQILLKGLSEDIYFIR